MANNAQVRLMLSDLSSRLNAPLQNTLYDGTSGKGGGAENKGLPKPILFGYCYNIRPIYLGSTNLGDGSLETYQVNWRQLDDVKAVRDAGVGLTEKTTAGAAAAGEWKQYKTDGCFQVGSVPAGVVTCDANGDENASNFYANNTGEVVTRILTDYGPKLPTSSLDDVTFTEVDAFMTGEIGWYRGTQEISTGGAIDQILQHAALRLSGGRNGKLRLSFVDPIVAPRFYLTEPDILRLEPVPLPADFSPAPSNIDIICERNWTPMGVSDIATSVSGSTRRKLLSPGARVRSSSQDIDRRQLPDRTLTLPGLFKVQADAQRRGDQFRSWIDLGLRAFEVTTDRYRNIFEMGDVVYLLYPKHGLNVTGGSAATGFTGVVSNWEEIASKGQCKITLIGS